MNYVNIFKALSDENRLEIINLLQDGEMCAGEILSSLNISQPTLSHHMKILCESGAVICKKSGRQIYYVVSTEAMRAASEFLLTLSSANDELKEREKNKKIKVHKAPSVKKEKKKDDARPSERQNERSNDIWLF